MIRCTISRTDIKGESHNSYRRTWKQFNLDLYRKELMETDWKKLYEIKNADIANSFLSDKITEALNKSAPLKRIQARKSYKSWLRDSTKMTMVERDNACEYARQTKTTEDWNHYKLLRNKCTKLQKTDKDDFEKKEFEDISDRNDTKCLFRKTKTMLNWKSGGPPTKFLVEGKLFQKAIDIANIQLKYYKKTN